LNEEDLYPSVAHWLRGQGYAAVVTGGQKLLSIPLVSYIPGKMFLEPDIVGFKEVSTLVAVEVKSDAKGIVDGLGKCLAYSAAADKVYLALSDDLCADVRSVKLFEHLKLGLLCLQKPEKKAVVNGSKLRLYTGEWTVEEKIAPGTNYNVDYSGLHAELLRQTKAALGKD